MTASFSPAGNRPWQPRQGQAFKLCVHAIAQLEQGRTAQAIAVIQQALAIDPGFAPGWLELGNAHMQADHLPEAIHSYHRALDIDPALQEAHANLAMAYRETGDPDGAVEAYRAALALDPGDTDALTDLGLLLQEQEQWQDAVETFQQAHSLAPSRALQLRIADLLLRLGDREGALGRYLEVLDGLEPPEDTGLKAEILAAIASLFHQMGQLEEAIASYGNALRLQPGWVAINDQRTLALEQLNTAIGHARQRLRTGNTGSPTPAAEAAKAEAAEAPAECLARIGWLLHRAGCLDEAIAAYGQALDLEPNQQGLTSLRTMAIEQSRDPQHLLLLARRFNLLALFDDELNTLEQAASLAPDDQAILVDRGISLLRCGRFAEGWPLYQQRGDQQGKPGVLPRWQPGMVCDRLLILPESALGDQIMVASMLREAAALASRPALLVEPRLYRLFVRSFPDLPVLIPGQPVDIGRYQAQIQLGGLGGILRPSKDHFLARRQAYLIADPARTDALRRRHRTSGELLVGLCWRSTSPANGVMKSLPLQAMAAALALPAVRLLSLQSGDTSAERAELQSRTGIVVNADPEIDAFNAVDDLAALIAACDLVVSVSNTTAHLAGALGQRTWLLIDPRLDWRWGLDGEDSLWYPEARIFRQPGPGDWRTPLAAIQRDLTQLLQRDAAWGDPDEVRGQTPTPAEPGAGGGAGVHPTLGHWVF
ncbi:MAG: tetratricopeptide repeat protein [Cyanobacteriota bacterium]|nr:tetratricopeptide repeat protein [Cyanobacteriota bacterium]